MKPNRSISTARRSRPRGATLVESAFVLSICLLFLLGMLELSVALMRNTAVSEAARRVARSAIVHGDMSANGSGPWGPGPLTLHAGSSHAAAVAARDVLITLPPADVAIELDWPDGSNQPDDRVQVRVSYLHTPIVPIPGWYTQLQLESVSTMRIAH